MEHQYRTFSMEKLLLGPILVKILEISNYDNLCTIRLFIVTFTNSLLAFLPQ